MQHPSLPFVALWLDGDFDIGSLGRAVVIVGFVTALAILLVRRNRPLNVLAAADKAAQAANHARAALLYGKARARIEAGSPKDVSLLLRALLGLAGSQLANKNLTGAREAFKSAKAAGAKLPVSGEIVLAEMYAETDDRSDDAFSSYLSYMEIGHAAGASSQQVFSAAQRMCEVQETTTSANRKVLSERNRRIIACNANLEWAHYYLGLAFLLDGRAEEALTCFTRVHTLNQHRVLVDYWIGVCYLQQAEPDLESAIPWIDKFLASPSESQRAAMRQASAAFEIGKRLLDRQDVTRAVGYLETANSRVGDNAEYNYFLGSALALNADNVKALEFLRKATTLAPNDKLFAYRFGLECEKAGLLEDASAALLRAVTIDGAYADAHRAVASITLRLNRYKIAENHARRFLQLCPGDIAVLAILIVALYGQEEFTAVVTALTGLSPSSFRAGDQADALFCAGRSHLLCGNFAPAVAFFEKLADERATYFKACALAHSGHTDEAGSILSGICRGKGPFTARAAAQCGHLLMLQNRFDEAKSMYLEVLRLQPGDASALHGLAFIAIMRDDLDAAQRHLDGVNPDDDARPEIRFARAVVSERFNKLDAAAEELRPLLQVRDWRDRAATRLGVLECRSGKFEQALATMASVIWNDPPDTILFYRGLALLMVGRIKESVGDWSLLEAKHPLDERLALNLHRARYLLGAQLVSQEQFEEAIEVWSAYLRGYPEDEKTSRDLAALYFRVGKAELDKEHGETASALQRFEKALESTPDDPRYLFYAAACDLRLGRLDSSEQRLRKLIAIEPTARSHYHLALCLLKKNATAEAIKWLKQSGDSPVDEYDVRAAFLLANEEIRQGNFEQAALHLALLTAN